MSIRWTGTKANYGTCVMYDRHRSDDVKRDRDRKCNRENRQEENKNKMSSQNTMDKIK